jgi:hypothetical protein
MRHETKERWIRLCEQAAVEKDPQILLKLVSEITRMLEEKEQRLTQSSRQQSGGKHGNVASSEAGNAKAAPRLSLLQ